MADSAATSATSVDDDSAKGAWLAMGSILFAGSVMLMIGMFQIFEGLAMLFAKTFYTISDSYPYRASTASWGIIHLLMGILTVAAGGYLFVGKLWARIIVICLALVSALTNFLSLPYYPFWSILIIALDVLVIWAVAAYGSELATD